MGTRILLADDDESFRDVMRFHLEDRGYEVEAARDGEEALERFREKPVPVVISDLKMPRLDGLGLLEELRRLSEDVLVIVVTAFGEIETAVEAMRRGAWDFIPKPFDRDHFLHVVERAQEHQRLRQEVRSLRERSGSEGKDLVFRDPVMRDLIERVDRIAETGAAVLITGESGTGKELLARRLHRRGPRAQSPFVPVNCAALPAGLLESELFGHRKGAFTGADRDRKGRFVEADGGTLFLDEVAEMPMELQPRLLRVLQEGIVDRVGSDRPIPVDVRIIAATNRDPAEAIRAGHLREDLFHRLATFPVRVPPLRERRGDIAPLVARFLSQHGAGRDLVVSPGLLRRLESAAWPGNVRELENVCQRLALMTTDGEIPETLLDDEGPETPLIGADGSVRLPPGGISLEALEREVIEQALAMNDHNQSRTARFLEIPRHVLLYRMEKFGIQARKGRGRS